MAAGDITSTKRYTNLVEFQGEALAAEDDAMTVHAHSSEFTFAVNVTGGANFDLAFECSFNDSNRSNDDNVCKRSYRNYIWRF